MAIRKRIDLFHKATEPVLEYYRKRDLLVEINGEKKIAEIKKSLKSIKRNMLTVSIHNFDQIKAVQDLLFKIEAG